MKIKKACLLPIIIGIQRSMLSIPIAIGTSTPWGSC